jgi:Flp pilus assembly protein TadB
MVDAPDHRRGAAVIPVVLAVGWAAVVVVIGRAHRSVPRCGDLLPARPRPGRSALPPPLGRIAPLLAGGALGWVLVGPLGAVTSIGLVVLARRARCARAIRRADAARAARLPDALDLLVLAGSAGLTSRQGLRLVAQRGPPVLRPAFADVIARVDAGAPLGEALPRLVESLGEPARSMVRAVLTAERDGVPIRSLLAHLADEARRQRRHELEAAARRLPVRLSFPLACCSLPAFVVLTVVPLAAAGLQRLGPVPL